MGWRYMKKILVSILLIISFLLSALSFAGCTIVVPDLLPDTPADDPADDGGEPDGDPDDGADDKEDGIDDGGLKDELEESAAPTDREADLYLAVAKGEKLMLDALLPDGVTASSWESGCVGIVEVSGGEATAMKCGRTELHALDSEGRTAFTLCVTVEFPIVNNNGYSFPTVNDPTVHKITDLADADRIIAEAVARHTSVITLDFSHFGKDFNPFMDYRAHCEFGNHVSFTMKKYESAPQVLYLYAEYNDKAATTSIKSTPEYFYNPKTSGNAVIRRALQDGNRRADDYEGFAINSFAKTMNVYNSEELWWAVEHGYKPSFPMANSKAELFYERAKIILREIITDEMTDLEKTVVIYEYLVHAVSYDYDTYYSAETAEEAKKNICYYLEGVFETGRAVCDGKSKAFVLLCGMEGIECLRDFGDKGMGTVGHAWNYVKLDGKWYMVDTTMGDVRFDSGSSIGKVFGENIETVDYSGLLISTATYDGEYNYSRLWNDVHELDGGVYTADLMKMPLADSVDFSVGSKEEMRALISALVKSGESKEYLLTLAIEPAALKYGQDVFDLTDDALRHAGLISPRNYYRVFESRINGQSVIYLIINGLN